MRLSIKNPVHDALHAGLCAGFLIRQATYNSLWSTYNVERVRKTRRSSYRRHKKDILENQKQYYTRNKERIKARIRNYESLKMANDPSFALQKRLRTRIRMAIKNDSKAGSAVRDLGCSIEYLKAYLEGQFEPGMSWDTWGRDGWHIDHIRPLSSFDLTDPEQFKQAVHYTNLQPLWAKENYSKGSTWAR